MTLPPAAFRILIVDDDPHLPQVVARLLRQEGAEVIVARGAGDARALCAGRPALALAVVDLTLGDGRGEDLIDELSDDFGDRAPPFVIFSGERPRRVPAGVLAVFEKPTGVRQLVELTRTIVASNARRAAARSGSVPKSPPRGSVVLDIAVDNGRDPRRER